MGAFSATYSPRTLQLIQKWFGHDFEFAESGLDESPTEEGRIPENIKVYNLPVSEDGETAKLSAVKKIVHRLDTVFDLLDKFVRSESSA